MQLITDTIGISTIVTLPGPNLDAGNIDEIKLLVDPIIAKGGRVIFDLSELEFVDSSGLGGLLSCLRRLTHFGGEMSICSLTKPVRVLFELVRMHRVFEICNDRAEALRSLDNADTAKVA